MILEVDAINTYYGKSHILQDISLNVNAGEVVAQGNVKVASNKGKAIYGRRLRHTNITATNNHSKMLEKLLDLDKFGNKNPWSDCCFIRQRQEIDWLYTD